MSTYGATQSWVACQKRRRRLKTKFTQRSRDAITVTWTTRRYSHFTSEYYKVSKSEVFEKFVPAANFWICWWRTQNCKNWCMCVKDISVQSWDIFLRHSVHIKSNESVVILWRAVLNTCFVKCNKHDVYLVVMKHWILIVMQIMFWVLIIMSFRCCARWWKHCCIQISFAAMKFFLKFVYSDSCWTSTMLSWWFLVFKLLIKCMYDS